MGMPVLPEARDALGGSEPTERAARPARRVEDPGAQPGARPEVEVQRAGVGADAARRLDEQPASSCRPAVEQRVANETAGMRREAEERPWSARAAVDPPEHDDDPPALRNGEAPEVPLHGAPVEADRVAEG